MSQPNYDLLVIGGGLTGLALACAAAGEGLRVLVVERARLASTVAPPFDGRVTAIAPGSRRLLEAIGVWPALERDAQPIRDIEVGERHSPLRVHYDHRDVGNEPLGHIVENRLIRMALLKRAEALAGDSLVLAAPDTVRRLDRRAGVATAHLESGTVAQAALCAVAEGRGSLTRDAAGIGATRWDYGQTGIVATIGHALPHDGLAIERFFPSGPFAILPMTGSRSSIVWAAHNDLARDLIGLDDAEFMEELAERFGDQLGDLELVGPRWNYPLSMVQAERYTEERLVLVGDAARAIHPIAGQGWNLALRDVAALAELVIDTDRLGLDLGSSVVLARYERWRRFDSLALIAITDGLNRLFGNDLLPVRVARELGLGLVERVAPLKGFFMRHAMGLIGDLPRAMRNASF